MKMPGDATDVADSGLAELRASARGWHGVQMAVLGFIGLCGVLQGSAGEGNPRWLQILAGLMVLLALVLSCLSIAVVATVAWPLQEPEAGHAEVAGRARRRLRTGITITFVAVGVLALAATSSWWPRKAADPGQVQVQTRGAGVLCGALQEAETGLLALDVGGRRILIELQDVAGVRPVDSC
jgi:hypothetical protein